MCPEEGISLLFVFVMKTKKIIVGCSGYYYPNWKGKFYPKDIPASRWLEHYASVFDTVELNGTFYKMPSLSGLKKNANATPEDFRFSVKMSRYVTHVLQLKNAQSAIKEFNGRVREGLGDKLHRILVQLPPSFQMNAENVDRLLGAGLGPVNAIEFRHISWWTPEIAGILKEIGCTFCNVDFPGMDTFFMYSNNELYLRMHGNPVLFKSSYDDKTLHLFRDEIPKNIQGAVYFNNTYYAAGFENALRFMELLRSV
jgi:uncharacterized protein YecE (DUF72 family)